MSDFFLREYSPADVPAMAEIWAENFGEPKDMALDFLKALADMGSAVTAEAEGALAGMACAVTDMELVQKGKAPQRCGYIFAVAVNKAFRGRGMGGALTNSAAELAKRKGAEIICVEPAEPELFPWYEKLLGVKCGLWRSKRELKSAAYTKMRPISAGEYMLFREDMLFSLPHIRLGAAAMEAQGKMLKSFGGGFFAFDGGVAAASLSGALCVVSELLCRDEKLKNAAAASLGAVLGRDVTLLYEADSEGSPYMAADKKFPKNCVWNLSFD